ncbi:MAG: hypothetical protein WC511_02070 [Candidatus Pacearchaeota archaeon]
MLSNEDLSRFVEEIAKLPPGAEQTLVSGVEDGLKPLSTIDLMKQFKDHLGEDLFNSYKGTELFQKELQSFAIKLAEQQLFNYFDIIVKTLKENYPNHTVDYNFFKKETFAHLVLLKMGIVR